MFREILFWDTGTLGCSLSIASVVVVVRFVFKSSFKSSGVVCTVLRSRLRCGTRSLGKQSCARRVGATWCASRCSGWQGRSAAGVTLPVVKGVRGSPSADAVREGSAGADPKSDRSIVPRNAREEVTFAGGAHCDLYDLYTRGGMWREWRSLSGGANRGSPVGCLQRLTAYKGGRAVDHEIMGMTSRGREKSSGRKVWESRWG